MAVPFLIQIVTTVLPAPRVTEQGVGLGFVSCLPFWEHRMHQHSCSASEGARWLLVTWQERSQSHWEKADGCCAQLVKGWGSTGVKGDGNTEQPQSCAYKYTPTAVGWWAVQAELYLCLLLLPTNKPLVEPCVPARRVHGLEGSTAPWYVPAGSWQQ